MSKRGKELSAEDQVELAAMEEREAVMASERPYDAAEETPEGYRDRIDASVLARRESVPLVFVPPPDPDHVVAVAVWHDGAAGWRGMECRIPFATLRPYLISPAHLHEPDALDVVVARYCDTLEALAEGV